jgi:hypothetical protein
MKNNLPLPVEVGMRLIVFILIIFVSMIIDNFSFGMMNAQNTLKTGLGISLLVGSNILGFMLGLHVIKPIVGLIIEETSPLNDESKELLNKYNNYKTNGIRSFASWWGYKLVEAELKKRKIIK